MLKRLELVGFKSFADKTAFDFPPGITAIVGPNGSGKSNIVDAVRWVLGEQSAKSLRGGEMTDVIFNGSASRRSLGLAEVTMTFDNVRRTLATDADEVQITRRVYRGGEGEYLINHQPCRLKDVKDLFLGSGAGADAYCIIEQGRVDVLLQASTRDRRIIFEEAAGISRFKAKKTETLRKLERVDQNLERLRDVLDEVEKQLRSVKLQAAKAQRYQEYAGRLKELRVGLGLQEFHQLSERLSAESAVLEGLRAGLAEQFARAEAEERELRELEQALTHLDGTIHEQEAALGNARQQIAAEETTLAHEWSLVADLETELSGTRLHLAELNRRVASLAAAVAAGAEELREVETQSLAQREAVRRAEETLAATDERLTALAAQVDADKAEHLDSMRQAARLQNDAVSYKAHLDNLARERERLRQKSEQAVEHLASLDVELEELTRAETALQDRLSAARGTLTELRQERDRLLQARDEAGQLAADLRARRSGLASRIEVLEGLERSHEGLGTGARELFALLEQPDPGPWRTVRGIVADFLAVRREFAPLIDLALGERAHRFLAEDANVLARALRERNRPFSSRVSFLPLPGSTAADASRLPVSESAPLVRANSSGPRVPSYPGVIALAEQVVRCDDPRMADLPSRLLGRTLIVRDLDVARTLAACLADCRFVTLQGELLEADGTLTVGTHHAETGILSRKSELRELREQAAGLDRAIAETDRDLADLRELLARQEGRAQNQQQEIDVLGEQLTDLRSRMGQHRQRREGLQEEVVVSRNEISGLEREIADLERAWLEASKQAAQAEANVQALQARLESAEREIRAQTDVRKERQQEALEARVFLAQVEERLASLHVQHQQVEADLIQRGQERQSRQRQLEVSQSRLVESQRTLLQASTLLANLYLQKETAERRLAEGAREANRLRQERQRLNEQAQADRANWRTQQEQAHARELEVNNLRHGRDALRERLREDYQIDLAEEYAKLKTRADSAEGQETSSARPVPVLPSGSVEEVNQEIAELRQKLSRLGSVHLDAIQEQNDLEARAGALRLQYDDLTAAQRSLQEIIAKINADSRRLFTETFATIRTHFQELFRKLFGGGMADAVLEDESDVLESGIEIVARPPGKELRGISLMSGGEKTMTAVALLLAIFRSKPSPFCILDEVDAALDEANIGRFTAVLRDFLDRSQFILVTHSKRTMACADVLYGVTMQESGISKRIAVRFEDWPDDERKSDEPAA
jgi:chromosome segregation protein